MLKAGRYLALTLGIHGKFASTHAICDQAYKILEGQKERQIFALKSSNLSTELKNLPQNPVDR